MNTQNLNPLKMYAKIKTNASVFVNNYGNNTELRNFLKANEGKFVEIETNYLFNNQYNTEKFRLYDSQICEIVNDARINKGKCKYCGTMIDKAKGDTCCNKYENNEDKAKNCKEYGIEWFTLENTFFLKYPRGLKAIESKEKNVGNNEIKIGTYSLEAYPSLDYLRLSNCRKTINFKFEGENYFVNNGIGWSQTRRLDVPESIQNKVRKACIELMNL